MTRRTSFLVSAAFAAFVTVGLAPVARGDGPDKPTLKCRAKCLDSVGPYADTCSSSPECKDACSSSGSQDACKSCVDKCVEPHMKAAKECFKRCGGH